MIKSIFISFLLLGQSLADRDVFYRPQEPMNTVTHVPREPSKRAPPSWDRRHHFENEVIELDDISEDTNIMNTIVTTVNNTDLYVTHSLIASGSSVIEAPLVLSQNSSFVIDVSSFITAQSVTSQGIIQIYSDSVLNIKNFIVLNTTISTFTSSNGTLQMMNSSMMSGSGTLDCIVVNNGTIAPGFSPGTLSISGLVLNENSVLVMEIQDDGNDFVLSSGPIVLGGELVLDFTRYTPKGFGIFNIMYSRSNITGSFDSFAVIGLSSNFFYEMQQSINSIVVLVNITPKVPRKSLQSPSPSSPGIILGVFLAIVFICSVIRFNMNRKQEQREQQLFFVNPLKV